MDNHGINMSNTPDLCQQVPEMDYEDILTKPNLQRGPALIDTATSTTHPDENSTSQMAMGWVHSTET